MAQNQILSNSVGSSVFTENSYKDVFQQAYFESFLDAPASKEIDADKHQVSEFQLVNSEGNKKIFNLKDKNLGKKVNQFLNPKVYIAKKSIRLNTTRFNFPVLTIGIKYDQVLKSTLQ